MSSMIFGNLHFLTLSTLQAAEEEAKRIQAELDRMAAETERQAQLQRDQQAMVISM